MEIWKDIEGYEGLYQVSNEGNVRSLNYRNTGVVKNLTPKNHNRGYLHVVLTKDKSNKSFLMHRLVASAFIPRSDKDMTINHIDENRLNNEVENLEWCSLKDNIQEFVNNHPKGRGRKEVKTPVSQYSSNGLLIKIWSSISEIKNTLGFSYWSIKECCTGNRHSAYGYKWQYVA